jgi:hypothetical protein
VIDEEISEVMIKKTREGDMPNNDRINAENVNIGIGDMPKF